jgi:hypothetical protein
MSSFVSFASKQPPDGKLEGDFIIFAPFGSKNNKIPLFCVKSFQNSLLILPQKDAWCEFYCFAVQSTAKQ